MDFFKKNKTTLPKGLASKLETTNPFPSNQIFPTRSGHFSVQIDHDSKKRLINSRFSPLEEAQKNVPTGSFSSNTLLIILGFGLGYHLQAWLSTYPNIKNIIIIEENSALFRTALALTDFTSAWDQKTIYFFVSSTIEEIKEGIIPLPIFSYDHIQFIFHPVLTEIQAEYYEQLQTAIESQIKALGSELGSSMFNRQLVVQNIVFSLFSGTLFYSINSLKQAFKGCPAIVIGAGPSLETFIHLLKPLQHNCLLIATDTSLSSLLSRDIIPHFIVATDYNEKNMRHFEDHFSSLAQSTLICTFSLYWKISNKFKGPIFPVLMKNPFVQYFIKDKPIDYFDAVLSASNLGIRFSKYIGVDMIWLMGQDLSFPNGSFYAQKTKKKGLHIIQNNGKPYLADAAGKIITAIQSIPGYEGTVQTTPEMFCCIQETENFIHQHPGTYYHCCENGAFIKGAIHQTVDQFTAPAPAAFNLQDQIVQCIGTNPKPLNPNMKKWESKKSRLAAQLRSYLKQAQEGLALVDLLQTEYKKTEADNLNRLRKTLVQNSQLMQLFEWANPSHSFLLFKKEKALKTEPTIEKQLDINRFLFQLIVKASLLLLTVIERQKNESTLHKPE